MTRKSICTLLLALLLFSPQAFARVTKVDVTKENQPELGLNFSLTLHKVKDKLYTVQFSAPKAGKLEKFRGASLLLYEGDQMLLSVPLQEHSEADSKAIALTFTVHKELLDKCVLSLMCSDIMIHTNYNIRISTYAPSAK